MEELEVVNFLVFKKDGEDGSEILIGGHVEALIIHATKSQKVTEGKLKLSAYTNS
jgi:tripartite-type tricarboxylate transporter receptor subunit TctC